MVVLRASCMGLVRPGMTPPVMDVYVICTVTVTSLFPFGPLIDTVPDGRLAALRALCTVLLTLDASGPVTAAMRAPSRDALDRTFMVIQILPNSIIPMSNKIKMGNTNANSTTDCPS